MTEPATLPPSLCLRCAFVKNVHGRHGQTYLLCTNTTINPKYPRQPVTNCVGFSPGTGKTRPVGHG